MLKSPKINTLAEGLIERTLSMLEEIESKTVHNNIRLHETDPAGHQLSISMSQG